jgi:gamma-glutamyltranspeptidase/glutathione hydrolase
MRALFLLFILGCSHQVKIVAPLVTEPRNAHDAQAPKAMVTSQGEGTTRAALTVLKAGGNIIDAFVAASFAISVERPHSTGLGGGGFLLYYHHGDKKTYAFDFRETAPARAHSRMYLTKRGDPQPLLSQEGALAVATPGLVKGLYQIHQRFGKLPWKEALAPAIELARNGFPLYEELSIALKDRKDILLQDPEAKKIFFTAQGEVPLLGALVVQENLAKTIEVIAQKGSNGFYRGKIARQIIKTVSKKRGILTHRDLRTYRMRERSPVMASYKGLKVFSMPPPSSGGIHVIQILKMLEPYDLKNMKPQSAKAVHLTANAMQRAFLDRATYLGDPDFHSIPTDELLNEEYLKTLSKEISTEQSIPADKLRPVALPHESSDTTHFTIADEEGNLVASTQTINGWFGSGVIAQGTGIILNNEMDDFSQKVGALNLFGAVGGKYNLVQAKKRPLSSMSPTILLKDDKPYMALGSPSGTRIITCVAQTILNVVEFEMPLYEAVAATRIHQQWQPDQLKIESPFLPEDVETELKDRGHDVVHGKLGCSIQAIQKKKSGWHGVSDPRGTGRAMGLD